MNDADLMAPPLPGAWYVLTGPNGSGKSRYLGQLAGDVLGQLQERKKGSYSRVLCLSGTVFERFPRAAYETGSSDILLYLGHKTNNNMFSAISPFRRLIPEILRLDRLAEARFGAALDLLKSLGLEGKVRIKFRQGRNGKDKLASAIPADVEIDFSAFPTGHDSMLVLSADALGTGGMHVSDVVFFKSGRELGLSDLSSGERGYILAGFAFCFCATDRSLILFDEPENSLHPEWQSSLIGSLERILTRLKIESTVVIATHSPLIASSIPNKSGYISDMRHDKEWRPFDYFGMNADTVLSEQFRLRSPRSAQSLEIIQNCLTLIADGQENTEEFSTASNAFMQLDLNLSESDPLYRTVRTIKKIIEARN